MTLTDCFIEANDGYQGGGIHAYASSFELVNCAFTGNAVEREGGALRCHAGHITISGCHFVSNSGAAAGALDFHDGCTVMIQDCLFQGNMGTSAGGAISLFCVCDGTIEGCTFIDNSANHGGAVYTNKITSTVLRDCTIWGNLSVTAAVDCGNYLTTIENCVIAFNLGGPAVRALYDPVVLSCSDLFGNEGGDWVGNISGQYGFDGNICEDPLFCDPISYDLMLQEDSPCAPFSAPNPECDLIGAWPVGCGGTPTVETSWGAIKGIFLGD